MSYFGWSNNPINRNHQFFFFDNVEFIPFRIDIFEVLFEKNQMDVILSHEMYDIDDDFICGSFNMTTMKLVSFNDVGYSRCNAVHLSS